MEIGQQYENMPTIYASSSTSTFFVQDPPPRYDYAGLDK
jgi:hypothetical protein